MRESWNRYLTWALGIALVLSLLAVVALGVNPPATTEPYTEFYVLGPGGNASGYPTALAPGESGDVIVGVSNHEHGRTTYQVVVTWNGTETTRRTVTVPAGRTERVNLPLTAPRDPGRYAVRFLLYRGDADRPYRRLRLFVRVSAADATALAPVGGRVRPRLS